jgi:hypothetical protein
MIRKYKDLQRAFKHQQMNQWLLNWEKIYAKSKRLNLSDVERSMRIRFSEFVANNEFVICVW